MAWDKKDRALVKAAALVGYCESAPELLRAQSPEIERWVNGLQEYAQGTGQAIADTFNESSVDQPKEE